MNEGSFLIRPEAFEIHQLLDYLLFSFVAIFPVTNIVSYTVTSFRLYEIVANFFNEIQF